MVKQADTCPNNGKWHMADGPTKCSSGKTIPRRTVGFRWMKGICDAVRERGLDGEFMDRQNGHLELEHFSDSNKFYRY
jgi:hypothetical protein